MSTAPLIDPYTLLPSPHTLRTGDVGLTDGFGVLGAVIRTKCWSDVNHAMCYARTEDILPVLRAARDVEYDRDRMTLLEHALVRLHDSSGPGVWLEANTGGVQVSPWRTDHLRYVMRPTGRLDVPGAMRWFTDHALGQEYDYIGVVFQFVARRGGALDKMFCSELVTRLYRDGFGFPLFRPAYDADLVSPEQLRQTPRLRTWWARDGGLDIGPVELEAA